MSDLSPAPAPANANAGPFRPVVVIALILVGVVAFVGIVLTYAFRPDTTPLGGSQAHALSNAGVGYSGIVRLVAAAGRQGYIVRDESDLDGAGLLVLAPPSGDTPIGDILMRRIDQPTLVVLPKWRTMANRDHRGWVDSVGTLETEEPEGVMAPGTQLKIARTSGRGRLAPAGNLPFSIDIAAPAVLQTMSGAGLTPLLTDREGRTVLAKLGARPLYVLAEPDLIANVGMGDFRSAVNAADMLGVLTGSEEAPIGFDVTLVGLGRPPNILRLAFQPPFLAMTLALLIAVLLASWQAFARFGPTARRERAIAFGKTALVDNSAALIAKAGKQAKLGGRYADVIRERARAAFGVPAKLRDDAVDTYLDKLKGRARFSDLAQAADAASDRSSLVDAARALHDWQKETAE